MRELHGFCLIANTEGSILRYELKHDYYSTNVYQDDMLHIVAQTSCKNKDTALDLAQQYKSCANNGKEFLASRHTCGSFVIIDKSQNVIITGRDRTIASHLYHYNKGNEHFLTSALFSAIR